MKTPNSRKLDERVRQMLIDSKGTWHQLAEEAEVSHSWLSKFARGVTNNPGLARLKRVERCIKLAQRRQEAAR